MNRMKPYTWKAPVAYKGDRVRFSAHGRFELNGEVMSVETHYSLTNNAAYHIYCILPDGWRVRRYVGEEHIIAHI